jgi:hypothetical protein
MNSLELKQREANDTPTDPFLPPIEKPEGLIMTREKKVDPDTFARLSSHYSEREICEIVWLIASEHLYNMTNIGLNIHSDLLCDISRKKSSRA